MSSNITYSSINASRYTRESEERKNKERKLHILCLIEQYLRDEGYVDCAKCLLGEAPVCKNYGVCDNIDLSTILLEYENYYYLRFQKYPKICKKLTEVDKNGCTEDFPKTKTINRLHSASTINGDGLNKGQSSNNVSKETSTVMKTSSHFMKNCKTSEVMDLRLEVHPIGPGTKNSNSEKSVSLLKPLSMFDDNSQDWKEMALEISKDILIDNPNVHWNDIIGHDAAKNILREAILYPILYPELFSGIIEPWKGLLLYGPPGTGKSLLAKAVATECNTTLIGISPSTVTSKWRGDSEKLVKVAFELARNNAPSTILVEEIDALMSRRFSPMEHEASRRMKTEFLSQMDKLVYHHNTIHQDRVFLLVTSNVPWEIDAAMLRRIEKRILVDLPTFTERQCLFEYFLTPNMKGKLNGPSLICQLDYSELAKVSEGYSGSDIKLVCKESIMERMRDVFLALENCNQGQDKADIHLQKLTTEDVKTSLMKTKPTAAKLSMKHNQWKDEFGST